MHSKSQILQLLKATGTRPKKHLGQNFLIDLNLMHLLVDSADIKNDDIVLEVGAGTGSLTQAIAEKAALCLAVELDPALAQIAAAQLADRHNVKIVNCDILEKKRDIATAVLDELSKAKRKYKGRLLLVANLPYNIASPLMLNFVTGPLTANAMFVTVQKEVADRMTANPGTKDYGTLTILLAATGNVKTIRTLKPSVFWPQPKINSAMLSYIRNKEKSAQIKNISLLSDLVNLFMQHRRKTLRSCSRFAAGTLAHINDWDNVFEQCSVDATARPAQISPQQYVSLANTCLDNLQPNNTR